MSGLGALVWIIILVVVVFVSLFLAIFGRILQRAGYSRWWLLTMLIPVVNVMMVWLFAFADWPNRTDS